MRFTGLQTALVMLVLAAPVAAEEPVARQASPFSRSALERSVREASAGATGVRLSRVAAAQTGRRDSILNGGLIGAAIGGVGGSFVLVAASGGSDDVGRAMLNVSPLTAALGFLVGAMVDATF